VPVVEASQSGSGPVAVFGGAKSLAAIAAPRAFDKAGKLSDPGWTGLRRGLGLAKIGYWIALPLLTLFGATTWAIALLTFLELQSAEPGLLSRIPPGVLSFLGNALPFVAYAGLAGYLASYLAGGLCLAVPRESRTRGPLIGSLLCTTAGVALLTAVYFNGAYAKFLDAFVARQLLYGGLAVWPVGALLFTRFLKATALCLEDSDLARSAGRLSLEIVIGIAAGFAAVVIYYFAEKNLELMTKLQTVIVCFPGAVGAAMFYLTLRMLMLVSGLRGVIAGHQVEDPAPPAEPPARPKLTAAEAIAAAEAEEKRKATAAKEDAAPAAPTRSSKSSAGKTGKSGEAKAGTGKSGQAESPATRSTAESGEILPDPEFSDVHRRYEDRPDS
jgi:hypothetical protein